MEYYEGKLCISARELVGKGIMTSANYAKKAGRGQIDVVRQGKGLGNYASSPLTAFHASIRKRCRNSIPTVTSPI